jgi:UDP-N-acetylglucosamine--N-acetylmuramyl-(pentapeptide) pyrophosphoryl-undecaprenol N-acetylglucosamine transferase
MTETADRPPLTPDPRSPIPAFLMAGGGTGGHVIPALAVARELRSRGHEVFFVGTTRGLESKLVPKEGFRLEIIEIGGLNRVSLQQRLTTLFRLPLTTLSCTRYKPAAVFSMGGYVAGPPVMAAIARGISVVVMEPNAVPGFTNRVIGRFVARALLSFPETARYFPSGRTELTGLPVREEFFQIPPKPRGAVLNLLVTGGSQGSRTLNRAARESWPLFRKGGFPVRIVHQSGPGEFEEMREAFSESGLDGEVVPFIMDMPGAFAAADLVVCRSGAGSVSELAASGKPAVLVPFPFATDDHQTHNAEALERGGAAKLVRDSEMTGERLVAVVTELAAASGRLDSMAKAAREFARPGAARRAADILEEVARF